MEAVVILLGYFLPTIVASMRGHHNGSAIFLLNLLLGWTGIGWVIALIWGFTYIPEDRREKKQKSEEEQLPPMPKKPKFD